MHPACAIIHVECVRESEEEPAMKDDFLPSTRHLLYYGISCDFAAFDFPCENSSMDVSTSDHSQHTPDVSLSLHYEEDIPFSENPFNLSSIIFENAKGEHYCVSSTPLHDSSDHEDANEPLKFSDHVFHDLFNRSFDHDADSFVDDISKTLVFDDPSIDEVKTP